MSHPQDLAATMHELAEVCGGPDGFTLAEVQARLADRTWLLLLILLPLPFISPIPMPGLSLPFGIAIAAIGLGIGLGRTPVIPACIRSRRCPPGLIARVLAATARQLGRLRALVRPRWVWLVERPWTRLVAGAVIAISGVLLALPLPVPFSNALPAYAILLTGLGLAQRDGLAILLGQGVFLGTLGFFATIAWATVTGVRMLAG
jgi:hypothetical protein